MPRTALLTFKQVRERLNTGKTSLYLLLERGELRALKVGASWRVEEADLEAFIASKKQAAIPPPVATTVSADADDDLPAVAVRRFM